jgi:ABC-type transport system involved in cytochrome bd biosynthesis fused ATPase/permease subunit
MNRVWDYIGFAVWFAGLGYIALWLTGPVGHLTLPPGLHALGVASAMFVPVRLVCRAVSRRRTAVSAARAVRPRSAATVLRPPRGKSSYPLRTVKPRSQFGLRGKRD